MKIKIEESFSRDFPVIRDALAGDGSPEGSGRAPKAYEWTLGTEALQALVDLIPNPPETTRETWIAVLHGVKGAGGSFETWDSWSSRWDHYDSGDTQKAWDGVTDSARGRRQVAGDGRGGGPFGLLGMDASGGPGGLR
jgi:hypothetical protein